jgi:hypothetical protein
VVNLLSTDLRAASVGCAVKTGRTEKLFNQSCRSVTENSLLFNDFSIFETAWLIQLPPACLSFAKTFTRSTCSATFAKLKYVLNALTNEAVFSTDKSLSAFSALPSRTANRTDSTKFNNSAPSCLTNVSPSKSANLRTSFRKAELSEFMG